jgi:ribosome recycling factor
MTNMKELSARMEHTLEALNKDFTGLRTGRASASLLDSITVEAYGSNMPLKQVANVSVPEARLLTVQVWDAGMAKAVEKAIANSGLGLNPIGEGQVIRVPLPELTEERRKDLVKVAGKYAEQAKVSIRNIRRDGMDELKKAEKAGDISEDDMHTQAEVVQKLTDGFVEKIDALLVDKEKDILKV